MNAQLYKIDLFKKNNDWKIYFFLLTTCILVLESKSLASIKRKIFQLRYAFVSLTHSRRMQIYDENLNDIEYLNDIPRSYFLLSCKMHQETQLSR